MIYVRFGCLKKMSMILFMKLRLLLCVWMKIKYLDMVDGALGQSELSNNRFEKIVFICRVKILFYPATEATNLLVSSEHAFTLLKDNDFHYILVRRDRQQPHGLTAIYKQNN